MSFGLAWYELLSSIIDSGNRSAPRDKPIIELLGQQIGVEDMTRNILVSPKRNLNYRFMVAEWLWIRHGSDTLDELTRYNKQIAQYSDDGVSLAGAYGPRLAQQWTWVRDRLVRDRDTRQAVATIFAPHDLMRPTKDVPCTLNLQYLIRQDRLHAIINMRSSDIWLGLPYDFFNFSMLAIEMATSLGIEPGSITFNLGSSHLYVTNLEQAMQILDEPDVETIDSPRKLISCRRYAAALEASRTSAQMLEALRCE